MMLRSLTEFSTYTDARRGSQADKDAIKTQGAILARAAIRELVAKTTRRLTYVLLDQPGDPAVVARVAMIRRYLTSTRRSDG